MGDSLSIAEQFWRKTNGSPEAYFMSCCAAKTQGHAHVKNV
jgi:hypothetical protein